MNNSEEIGANQEIESKIRSAFPTRDPDPLFIDHLETKLVERFKELERSGEEKDKNPRRSPWLDKSKLLLSPLAWGAIGIIFILLMVWGIKTLIPRVGPSISSPSTPTPIVSPAPVIEPTQAENVAPSPIASPTLVMEPTQAEVAGPGINLPVLAGMPVPQPEEAITSINADQITQLARWGRETINAVAWAPDGNSFAVASTTKIQIYDSLTFKVIQTIDNGSPVYQIAYSPDGTKLASAYNDTKVKIWDITRGSELQTLNGHNNFITHLAFSPDGDILGMAAYQEPMKLWEVSSGQELRTLNSPTAYNFVFSPDGTVLATIGEDNLVRLWDVTSGQELRNYSGHADYLNGVAFSTDGKMLASTSADMTIKLWEVSTGQELKTLNDQAMPSGVAFLPDGNSLITIAEGEPITVWDVATGQVVRTFGDSLQWGYILLSPDGKIVLNYGYGGEAIKFYDIASGAELRRLDWQTYLATSLAVSTDGEMVAIGLDSGAIKILDANTGLELRSLAGHTKEAGYVKEVDSLAFSPDGAMLVSGSMDTTTRVWDVTSGAQLDMMDGVNEFGWAGGAPSVDFSPDGKYLAFAGRGGQVKVWDVAKHVELHSLGGSADSSSVDPVAAVAFSPDGKTLASGYFSGQITLWDGLSGEELRTVSYSSSQWLVGVSELEFSPDGVNLAAGYGDANIILWDVASGSELYRHSYAWQNGITGLAFSPDGSVLAIGSGFGSMALLDVDTGNELITLALAANGLAFSPDGKMLISGAYDGAIRVWGMAPANAVQQETTPVLPSEEISPVAEPSPEPTIEELNVEKVTIPILFTGANIEPGEWSPDASYLYYSEQGPIGEPSPDQAVVTISFLDARTGETCQGIQETVTFTQTAWGPSPEGIGLYERARWLSGSRLMYLSPNGELMAITPCSEPTDNLAASVPDTITSLTYSVKDDGSQIILKGEQGYWLFTPATRQSVKLNIPLPKEGMETGVGWIPGEEKLYTSRIEDRGGLWIVLESIDPTTGTSTPLYEVQASVYLNNVEPKYADVDWIDKDLLVINDTITGGVLIDLSTQPVQSTNLFPDLFGFEKPPMETISAWGVTHNSTRQDYHIILTTGMAADGKNYIYHSESGVVDQYPLNPPILVVGPGANGGIAQSFVEIPQTYDTLRVIWVDSDTAPYDLVVKGHPSVTNVWSFATVLPGVEKVLFSSSSGISIEDIKSGEVLNFWELENQEQYSDSYTILSPDGKTLIGFASPQAGPGEGTTTQSMYWLRLEP